MQFYHMGEKYEVDTATKILRIIGTFAWLLFYYFIALLIRPVPGVPGEVLGLAVFACTILTLVIYYRYFS